MKEEITMENQTLMQYFEWYLPLMASTGRVLLKMPNI